MSPQLIYDAPSLPASSRAIFARVNLVTILGFCAALSAAAAFVH